MACWLVLSRDPRVSCLPPGVLLNARCSSQEELDEACAAAVAKAAALKESLRVACEAMREEAGCNDEPQSDRQSASSQQATAPAAPGSPAGRRSTSGGLLSAGPALGGDGAPMVHPSADEAEAEAEAERARASWAAVHRFEDLLEFAAEVHEVRASESVAAVVDSTGALARFDAFAASQYQEVLRAAEAESRRCEAKAEALQSARATRLHLLAEQKQEEEARASPPKDVKAQLVAAKKAAKRAVNKAVKESFRG